MKEQVKAHIAIFLANVIYGLNYTITKGITPDYVHPFALTFMRVTVTCVLFWSISFFYKTEKIEKKDRIRLFISALLGIILNQTLFISGIALSTPINASIIVTVGPILVIVASYFALKTPFTINKIIGVALGCAGAILLVLHRGNANFSSSTMLGNFILFANASFYAIYLVIVKPLMGKYSVITIMKWSFFLGFIFLAPVSYHQLSTTKWAEIPLGIWFSITFLIIMATFFGYLLNVKSLKTLSPTVVGFYLYLQPIVSTIFAVSMGKDSLNITKIISMLMIFTGVFFINKQSKVLNELRIKN